MMCWGKGGGWGGVSGGATSVSKNFPMGSVDFSIPQSAIFWTDVKEEISK